MLEKELLASMFVVVRTNLILFDQPILILHMFSVFFPF
jgi:hypothetical protein